ncbi:hypothetical protein ACF08W_33925 [Streptomyces sp. NPDC015144]|uniref:hypothetical protein n=1 Tax=Streptomyces sp. NPDC015144 TaxID=3364944 RepID=UPI0036FEC9A1
MSHAREHTLVRRPATTLKTNRDHRYTGTRTPHPRSSRLHRIGFHAEAEVLLTRALDAPEHGHRRPRTMHTLNGNQLPDEIEDPRAGGLPRP